MCVCIFTERAHHGPRICRKNPASSNGPNRAAPPPPRPSPRCLYPPVLALVLLGMVGSSPGASPLVLVFDVSTWTFVGYFARGLESGPV